MFERLSGLLTFGNRYWTASLTYLGFTMLMWGLLPELNSFADNRENSSCSVTVTVADEFGNVETVVFSNCPDGYMCCEKTGECVSIDE